MPKLKLDKLKLTKSLYEQDTTKPQASVLLALVDAQNGIGEDDPKLILTQRSVNLSSHAGEVSLPGGKWEEGDKDLVATALRETEEEIGLPASAVEPLGQLYPMVSKHGLQVTPIVSQVAHLPPLTANPGELDAVFLVPLSFFLQDRRSATHVFTNEGVSSWSPTWYFEGYKIWGLTARFIVDLLNHCYDAKLTRKHCAPEITFSRR